MEVEKLVLNFCYFEFCDTPYSTVLHFALILGLKGQRVKLASNISTFDGQAGGIDRSGKDDLDVLRDWLQLRQEKLSQLMDGGHASETEFDHIAEYGEMERRSLHEVSQIKSSSHLELAYKLAHWILLKDLNNPDVEPSDIADELIFSCFEDIVGLEPDPALAALLAQRLAPCCVSVVK